MSKRLKWFLIMMLIGGVTVTGVAANVLAQRAREAERQRDIAEANLEAARDTLTRFEDSLSVTTSLMQTQGQLSQDSILLLNTTLARAIFEREQTIRSLQTMRLEFARLQGSYASVRVQLAEDSAAHVGDEELAAGEEQASFTIDGPPIEGSLFVTRRIDGPWGLRTDLGVSPFSMTYSVGCQGRAPVVNLTTPPWVNATPERGTVAPDVCNPVQPNTGWGGLFRIDFGKSIWGIAGGVAGWFLHSWLDSDSKESGPSCYDDYCGSVR